jgi:ATP-dependent exoDNAse (exonuclease V) beta subunit
MEHLPASKNTNDYLKIIRYVESKENDYSNRFKYLGDELSSAWEARGNSNETFGVIVSKNEDANDLAEYLRSLNLPALSESESAIIDLPTTTTLLALLKLIEHPDDTLAWETVKRTPILSIIYPEISDIKTLTLTIAAQYAAYGLARLTSMCVKKLIQDVKTPLDAISKQRLSAIATAADIFERTSHSTAGIDDFIEYLQMQNQRSIVTDPNTIRVITIHRSKGLGFDHVFLPIQRSQTGLTAISNVNATISYDITNEIPWTAKLSKEFIASFPKIARVYEQTIDAQILSTLHSYYVAMTRSKQSLTILYEQPKNADKNTYRFESFIDAVVSDKSPITIDQNAAIVYEAGIPPPPLSKTPIKSPPEATTDLYNLSNLQLPSKHTSEQPSKLNETYFMSDFFSDTHSAAKKRGTEIHKQLESIEWIDPKHPKTHLDEILLTTPLCEAFLRPVGEVTLLREYSYDRFINNTWQTGQFDRVIITGTGETRHAIIYDYKTNQNTQQLPLENFAQLMAEKYHHQMTSYRDALSHLFQIPHEAIETKLLLLDTNQVVPVQ